MKRLSERIEVTHEAITSAKTSITIVPCDPTPFSEQSLPLLKVYTRCPDNQLSDSLRNGLKETASDLYNKRGEIDAMVMLRERLDTLFTGSVPDPFPGSGNDLAGLVMEQYLGMMIFDLYNVLGSAQTPIQLREMIIERDHYAVDLLYGVELANYMHISTLAKEHLDFFSSYASGGSDGWWYLGAGATADRFSNHEIVGLVKSSLDGFMTGFHFNNAMGQATPAAMELGSQAAVLSALMGAVQLGGF